MLSARLEIIIIPTVDNITMKMDEFITRMHFPGYCNERKPCKRSMYSRQISFIENKHGRFSHLKCAI
jgi:hypothetical protein